MAMNAQGMLKYESGSVMSPIIQKVQTELVSMPIVGSIPCGSPSEEEENIEEYVSLPRAIFVKGDLYILRAAGDSMVDAGIYDGSLVVVRKQQEAKYGDIVVALCEHENTLKRLIYDAVTDRPVLDPENAERKYPDIVPGNFIIQGVAIYVMNPLG